MFGCAADSVKTTQPETATLANASETQPLDQAPGKHLYEVNCAICHDKGLAEAPLTDALRKLTADHISRSLNDGAMLVQSGHLTPDERNTIATYLGTIAVDDGVSGQGTEAGYCAEGHEVNAQQQKVKIGDWGFGLTNERAIEDSPISPSNVGALELDWVFAFPNSARARAQPTVAGDTVFTASHSGKIYALDLNCGCILWDFKVDAEVRSAISIDTDEDGNAIRLYFGDFAGNVYGFDIASRQILWKIRADNHPIATITGSLRTRE